jgi:hypothetical protein
MQHLNTTSYIQAAVCGALVAVILAAAPALAAKEKPTGEHKHSSSKSLLVLPVSAAVDTGTNSSEGQNASEDTHQQPTAEPKQAEDPSPAPAQPTDASETTPAPVVPQQPRAEAAHAPVSPQAFVPTAANPRITTASTGVFSPQLINGSEGANVYARNDALTPFQTLQLFLLSLLLGALGYLFANDSALARLYAWLARVIGVKAPLQAMQSRHV